MGDVRPLDSRIKQGVARPLHPTVRLGDSDAVWHSIYGGTLMLCALVPSRTCLDLS